MAGRVISHYRLLERIGTGQDAAIYRARDVTLGRDVAIRVLEIGQAEPEALERFRREARIASLVSHPHIRAVHDSGEEHGCAFLVCELLEGRTLDALMQAGALPPADVLDLLVQLADALSAVHRRTIVHGSVQPSNVFVTHDGHVKLLGLGTAGARRESDPAQEPAGGSSPTVSQPQMVMAPAGGATDRWQAPEQTAGGPIDARADIFAAGALLRDLTAGSRRLPRAIRAVVERAVRPEPERRYQSAAALMADLKEARRRLDSPAGSLRRLLPVPHGSALALALFLGVLALAGAIRWWGIPAGAPAPGRHSVLIATIANGTGDPDFDGTLRQALAVHLEQSPFLDLVPDERIRETLQRMGRAPDDRLAHDTAREACQRLGLNAMIEGSVSALGRLTVVALAATDCHTGETIARDQAEVERKEDVLGAVGTLASSMRRSLGESAASLDRHNVPIEDATTPSLEALKAYTAATRQRAAGAELESIPLLERAIGLDERFAVAYTTLSTLYGNLGETSRSETYARFAYERREHVSERERLFITYQYHDRVTGDQLRAREALEVWKRSFPRDYRAPNALAVLLNRLGDYDAAAAEAAEAIDRNPAHAFPYSNLAYAHRGAGRFAEARQAAERAVALGIETMPTRRLLYQLAELEADEEAARRHVEWARGRSRGFDMTGAQAQVAAFRGRMAEARALYGRTTAEAAESGLRQVGWGYTAQAALIEALYGNRQAAAAMARTVPADTTYAPQLRAAAALALAGAPDEAEAIVRRWRGVRPDDTLLQAVYLPAAEAALLLARGRPDAAVQALRPGVPYERGQVAALLPAYLRGEARSRAGAFGEAAREYRAVLEGRGADPFAAVVPLAQLGLARALARSGDTAGAQQACDALAEMWRDADPAGSARGQTGVRPRCD